MMGLLTISVHTINIIFGLKSDLGSADLKIQNEGGGWREWEIIGPYAFTFTNTSYVHDLQGINWQEETVPTVHFNINDQLLGKGLHAKE